MSADTPNTPEAVEREVRDMGDTVEDVLSPRQEKLVEEYVSIAEEFGPFDTTTGAEGAHYAPADANPFIAEGLVCQNCELYQPISDTEGRCAVVAGPLEGGNIEPNAICKLWVIPESKFASTQAAARELPVKKEVRVIGEREIRDNPSLVDELRQGGDFIEQRNAPVTMDVRAAQDGKHWILTGHAAVFNSESGDLGGFREVIQRGAFRKVLKRSDLSVAALFNHDQNLVLAHTGNGTLTLREDPKGLVYTATVPIGLSYGDDLRMLLDNGTITKSSFAFRVKSDGQTWSEAADGTLLRTITEFDDLADVSPVLTPAYEATSSASVGTRADNRNESSSTRVSEQEGQGAAAQQSSQADPQPRRAGDEGAHRLRVRRQKLRDRAA